MLINDFVTNQSGSLVPTGPVASRLGEVNYDPGFLRPYINDDGERCISINTGEFEEDEEGKRVSVYEEIPISHMMSKGFWHPIYNSALPKQAWELYDDRVVEIARKRLRAWTDLSSASSMSFDGLPYMVLEHETVNDPGEAQVDFDGTMEATTDQNVYVLEGVPLPITHSNFHYSHRFKAAVDRRGGGVTSRSLEYAARRVAEKIEQTLIGTITGITGQNAANYGRTPTVYGYTNFPARVTATSLTTPTGSNGETTVTEVLGMIEAAQDINRFGPFMLYHSPNWSKYLDDDYRSQDDRTLRNRLRQIEQIQDVRQLDYLTDGTKFVLVLVEMNSTTAQAVTGLPMTTVMWETHGGLKTHIKVMTIMVPRLFADQDGSCGIVHYTDS